MRWSDDNLARKIEPLPADRPRHRTRTRRVPKAEVVFWIVIVLAAVYFGGHVIAWLIR